MKELKLKIGLDKSVATREARAFEAEAKRINKALADDAKATAKAEADAAKAAAREKADAARSAAKADSEASRAAARDKEAAAKAAEKAAAEAAKAAAREKILAAKAVQKAALEAGAAEKKSLDDMNSASGAAAMSVGNLIQTVIGLGGVSGAVALVVDHFKEVNKAVFEAGEFVQGYRKALLELAALKGQLGKTTLTVGESIEFRKKTLQSADQARDFQALALGVGGGSVDEGNQKRLISKDEFQKAMELGGGFQAAEGGDAKAHATLIGLLPQLIGRRTTGGEVARAEKQLFNIFQPGGPEFSSMARQYATIAPLITSKTYDPMKAGALLSAFSTSAGEQSAERVTQFTRATLGGVDKTTKGRVDDSTPQGEYYKEIGITDDVLKKTKPTELPFVIADKVVEDLNKQEAESKKKGEEFHPLVYMKHHGFANEEDTRALLQYRGLVNSGLMGKTFMPLAEDKGMPSEADVVADIAKAQRTEPVLQGRKAELAAESAKVAIGAGKQEFITNLQGVAFNRLKAQGDVSGEYTEGIQNQLPFMPSEMIWGYRRKTELESQNMLLGEARRVGVKGADDLVKYRVDAKTGDRTPEYMGHDALYRLGKEVQAHGGTSVPGLEQVTGAAQRSLDESARFEGIDKKPAAPVELKEGKEIVQELREMNKKLGAAPPQNPRAKAPLLERPAVQTR